MNTIRLFACVALAGTILATPVAAREDRKSLLQVLFPKAHERKLERERLRRETLAKEQQKNLVRVPKTRYYTYRVAKRAPILISPVEVEYASVGSIGSSGDHPALSDIPTKPLVAVEPSVMTKNLNSAGKQRLSAENFLAKAVSDHYSQRQEYLWISENGEWNARARSVRKILDSADEYGLRSEDYALQIDPASKEVTEDNREKSDAANRIKREVAMSVAVLRYAMDARFGTVNPNRLSGYHDFKEHYNEAPEVMDEILGNGLPARTLISMHPSNEKFMALKRELASISETEDDIIDLPAKILIKPGASNDALPQFIAAVRKRASHELLEAHSDFLAAYSGDLIYGPDAVKLVKAYQKEAGLGPDGVIGPNTSRKLAGLTAGSRVDQVVLAMERLRWLPHDLGERHVFINQPEFRARYINGGEENLSMRVVVGKKSNQTNFFYDEIEHVEYNPYWGVPRSIIVNEFAAKSLANPGYLDQLGYEVTNRSGRRISSASIDWTTVGANPNFDVRQPPGAKNALGSVKIMFPNRHAIYMHDTPSKHLFQRSSRAFSHGCVRLHDPHGMAAAVLGKSKAHVKSMINTGKNQQENLRTRVPVYVSYFTAWPQEDGTVKYFADMYGRDAHLMKAFKATQKARSSGISS